MTSTDLTVERFQENRLLATFAPELCDRFLKDAVLLRLEDGETLFKRGDQIDRSIFPLGATTLSIVVLLDDSRRSIEAASIGSEGAMGGIITCGHAPAFAEVRVIVGGLALSVPQEAVEAAKKESAHLANLFCRFADFLIAEIMQSVACHAFHPIDQRAARWLATASDRAGPRVELTQEAFAALMGAQRTTINAVARDLQAEGLINVRRGAVEVLDVEGLKKRACSCYDAISRFFDEVIGTNGEGRGDQGCS